MKKIALFFLLVLIAHSLIANDGAGNGISSSSSFVLQGSSLPEIKLGFVKQFYFPFLQGEGPLTEGNNIEIALTAELSPISLNGLFETIWTPIAFFQLNAGGRIGSGWVINLFGNDIYGIGLNRKGEGNKAEHDGKAFDGLFLRAHTGAAFQMDLAALFPGDWNHVILRSYHEINYFGYTRAAKHESWYIDDNPDGDYCNGFNYYGNLVLGYQMPIFFNMVALLAEGYLYLYDTPGRSQWRDDKIKWTFSGILNFELGKKWSIALLTQFRTRINYTDPDWEDVYYRNRTINEDDPVRLEFYRVAAIITLKL